MDGHGGHPHILHAPGKLHTVDGALVPAQTEFHGDRLAGGPPHHGGGHSGSLLRVLHQGGAIPGPGDFGHGTAHVDVDDVRPGLLQGQGSALLHGGLVAAENLDGTGVLSLAQGEEGGGLFISIAQGLGADHLGDGVTAGQLPAYGAEGHVGDPRHGSQHDFGVQFNIAYFHKAFSFAHQCHPSYHRLHHRARQVTTSFLTIGGYNGPNWTNARDSL